MVTMRPYIQIINLTPKSIFVKVVTKNWMPEGKS